MGVRGDWSSLRVGGRERDVRRRLARLEDVNLFRVEMYFHRVICLKSNVRLDTDDEFGPCIGAQVNVGPGSQWLNDINI